MEDFMLRKIITDNFSDVYPRLNKYVVENGEKIQSRNGICCEVLNFSTTLINPRKRCVGVLGRNMNVFFLIAEAIWIAAGRKDVEWLDIFNSNMKQYSDDGKVFHAPYGYRLMRWGGFSEMNLDAGRTIQPLDQVAEAIRILADDPNSRQVVMSIWNPDLDLGYKTKDLPCNDMVMLKVRNDKLIMTIANRSNDLHLGLPTNIFQFSWLGEIIAECLGIDLGTQTHNSQSLHVYTNMNQIWKKIMIDNNDAEYNTIYDFAKPKRMNFNFSEQICGNRIFEVRYHLNSAIKNLFSIWRNEEVNQVELSALGDFSKFLYDCYRLLGIYVTYKQELSSVNSIVNKDLLLQTNIEMIDNMFDVEWDFAVMAKNFFASRLSKNVNNAIGSL